MNLTLDQLITLVEEYDSKCVAFESYIANYSNIDPRELEEYNKNSIIVLLGLMKLEQLTAAEMLEKCLTNLHK